MDGDTRQTLVIIGNGMMSYELCRRLVVCGATEAALRVVVFGEEPRPAYDRVHLTDMLSGKSEADLTLAPATWYAERGIELYLGDPVVAIDRLECQVRSAAGVTVPYDRLVLATGSRPFVPPIEGTALPGVFVYRTVDDLRAILAYAGGAARAAVIGGGLLGLEAARAVRALGLEVHVLEAGAGLLPRHLDEVGARLLRERMEGLGVRVRTGARTARIEDAGGPSKIPPPVPVPVPVPVPDLRIRKGTGTGTGRSEAPARILRLQDGGRLTVELVVLAAGIRPRTELARAAGLELDATGGVVVDDHLVTSDARVFAVGECASHRGTTYGLAPPGYRMIEVLVDNLVGGAATFEGADRSTRLKLLGVTVASLGRPDERETPGSAVHTYLAGAVYRKLVLFQGRIAGAIAVGEWDDLPRVESALGDPRRFSFWDTRRFRGTGTLWLKSESPPVHEWAADALVCGCLGVRRGAITEAELEGCSTVDALTARTGAGTMCGSCRPLLADYLHRDRADSLPPSQLDRAEDTPPTLRCRDLPDGPASPVVSSPAPGRWVDAAAPLDAPPFPFPPAPRPPLDTLVSAAATLESAPRVEVPPTLAPPTLFEAPSSRDAAPPSSRCDTMRPLQPISVPSARLSLRAPRVPATLAPPARVEEPGRVGLLITSAAAVLGALVTALGPALGPARSFRGLHAAALVSDRLVRQASGYAMIGLSVLGLLLSLRKRWRRFTWGSVPGLRVAHGALGAASLVCLWAHTGLHLGEHMNRLLMLDFVGLAALGGVAGAVSALDPAAAQACRQLATRAHLAVLIPLPILVALHVLGAYYF